MNWDSYRYFLAVAETGSLSAAARMLAVSQPTVGRQIAELEERVGTRLFDRASHGYTLTLAGKQIIQKVRAIGSDIAGVDRQVEGLDKDYSGHVRISATEGFGAYWLTPKLADLHQIYPNITFELFLDVVVLDTRKREADIAIRLSNPKSGDLVGRCVGNVGFGLYGSSVYVQRHGIPQSISDLQNHKFIDWHFQEKGFVLSSAMTNLIDRSQVVFRTDTVAAQIEATLSGIGIMLAPHYMVPENKGIVRMLPGDVDHREELWILTHRDLRHTTRIRAVIDYLADAIKSDSTLR